MKHLRQVAVIAGIVLASTGQVIAGQTISKSFQGITAVELDFVSGDAIIHGGKGTQVTLELTFSYDQDCFEPRIEQRGDHLILEEDFHGYSCSGHSTWHLTVPADLNIDFSSASGDLDLTGVNGEFDLSSASGDLTLTDSKGEFEIDNASGRILITRCSGEFDIDNASGRISLKDISGDIDLDNASGRIVIDNASGRFRIDNASGDVDARGLQVDHRSSFSTASGDIEISLARSLTQDVTLSSASGDALLNYAGHPVRGTFEFQARADRGHIESPFPFDSEAEFSGDWGRSRWGAAVYVKKIFTRGAEGPRVLLRTGTGSVVLREN